jgi:ribonuclease P protein component
LTSGAGVGRGFARRQRLLKGKEFERVFAAPRRSSDRFFTVLVRDNGMPHGRLGLAVSKKRIRSAVARNRIKRLVRESFRHHAGWLCGLDAVVMARQDSAASNCDLRRSLEAHWLRLGSECPPA